MCIRDRLYIIELIGASNLCNVLVLVKFVLSIFPSNAFTERVFSIMNIKWRDKRNRCSVDLIKNELYTYFNYDERCSDFYKNVLSNEKVLRRCV